MVSFPERSLQVLHFDEPPLEFAFGQRTAHPKDGLVLYGAHSGPRRPKDIRIGVVGTTQGIAYFRKWAGNLRGIVKVPPPGKGQKQDRLHLADFPGMDATFQLTYDPSEFSALTIDPREIDQATSLINLHEAVAKTVSLYIDPIKRHLRNEERVIDVWVLVVPEIVFDRCRPESKRPNVTLVKGDFARRQKGRVDLPLLTAVIDQSGEEIFDDAADFHRQVKAAMLTIAPTQLVRETTIAPEEFLNQAGYPVRNTQDRATVAWNFATGLYYKAQPEPPWKLAGVREGVCYIGLVHKNIPNHPQHHACCAAQLFLSEGDGVVFRGANGPWKTSDFEYHLSFDAAKQLVETVLQTYAERHPSPPRELFIHGQASFNEEEWSGFENAAPKDTNVVGVRIKTTGGETKLFRDGDYPVLRGTAMILDDRNAYLWTTGYVPQLDTYIGPETPNPLFISVMKSKGPMPDIRQVLVDIMGLTKINYNSCNFNDGLPVTVRFARMVGDVLTMGSAKGAERQPFKFYV